MKNEVNKEFIKRLAVAVAEMSEPSLYQVALYNDDFTPMEFAVSILEKFFYMDRRKAIEVMLEAHVKGKGICGIFSKDVAEAKVDQVMAYAKQYDHPLMCGMEASK